jgi:hypothetical protein
MIGLLRWNTLIVILWEVKDMVKIVTRIIDI